MIDLAAFQANGDAYIKLRLAGTVNSRERRILMTLRFIHLKQSNHRISKGRFALLSLFFNWQNTLFDVGRSMFDVRSSLLYETTVSFPIKPAAFQAGGWADT